MSSNDEQSVASLGQRLPIRPVEDFGFDRIEVYLLYSLRDFLFIDYGSHFTARWQCFLAIQAYNLEGATKRRNIWPWPTTNI